MDVGAKQKVQLGKTIEQAKELRASLQPLLDANGHRVHFRPSSTAVAMVGLLAKWPQRGKSGITNLDAFAQNFEAEFAAHCSGGEERRPTPEKKLQSFLIREAYTNQRRMLPISNASGATNDPVDLRFVTDEIALPVESGKRMVCDVLALRRDGGRCTPVVMELKSSRLMTRLAQQVNGYAQLVDTHAHLFAQLFAALLGEDVAFDGAAEKWVVWPAAGPGQDPREAELADQGIRVASYGESDAGYTFRVGNKAQRGS
jgi:hypothetical protein